MTLRRKTLIIISLTLIGLIGILYAVLQTIMMGSFAELEIQNTTNNVERALNALDDDIGGLVTMTNDWATWDDTYKFIEDRNEGYIAVNPTDEGMMALRVNVMLFIDSSGEIVYGKGFDLANEQEVAVPQGLTTHLTGDSLLLNHPDAESSISGILLLSEGSMLIASEPILTSDGEGPVRGSLVWGRYLDDTEVSGLAETTRLSLTVHQLSESELPPDFEIAHSELSSTGTSTFVRPLDREFVAGYTVLEDIYGTPILMMRVDIPRAIYQQGQASLVYLISSLVIVGFVFVVAVLLLLEKLVLAPVSRLSASVNDIGASGDLSARVSITGSDELASLAGNINGMLGGLKQSHSALQESEKKFKHLVQEMNDGYFVIQDAKVVFTNTRGTEMFGHAEDEITGKHVDELLAPELARRLARMDADVAQGEAIAQQYETRLIRGDGKTGMFELSAKNMDYAGKPAVSVVMRDITERRKAEEELARQAKELARANSELCVVNKELEAFSYSVSHDLRAPLRSIDGFSKAVLEDYEQKLDDQGKDYLHRVRAASQRMAQLIDDLLNLSRVTRSDMHHDSVNLSAMAWSIVTELQKIQPDRQVDFVIAEGLMAKGDSRLLKLVLENLLNNAWKFTGKHTHAKIEFGAAPCNGKTAYFVRDDGAGFDMAYAEKLFIPFQRLHGVTEFAGTGIGLALIQRIIHRHGGHVWAEGKVEQGATFYFTLQ
jgi:hypothetical protein